MTLEDGVFIGPHVVFANDRFPRAVNPDGSLKSDEDWTVERSLVQHGAAVGAAAVVLPGITIGPWAMVGAGSVVTANVPAQALVRGIRHESWAGSASAGVRCERRTAHVPLLTSAIGHTTSRSWRTESRRRNAHRGPPQTAAPP